ncbi:low molecular weight phosphotyrosine protein phosphatase, partial [Vibrio vulnificus]|nr:low molecular weight phosphotyrosine protein phosphatase [Vibrio vulnificus]
MCQSPPTGERVLQKLLPHKTVAPAATAAEKSRSLGKPPPPMAIEVAQENDVDVANPQSQQLTSARSL